MCILSLGGIQTLNKLNQYMHTFRGGKHDCDFKIELEMMTLHLKGERAVYIVLLINSWIKLYPLKVMPLSVTYVYITHLFHVNLCSIKYTQCLYLSYLETLTLYKCTCTRFSPNVLSTIALYDKVVKLVATAHI